MRRHILFFAFLLIFPLKLFANLQSPYFYVVITSYNNEKWCIKNLESIVEQNYPHWEAVYVNDCSEDATGALVDSYVLQHNLSDKVKVLHNSQRQGMLANIYNVVQKARPHWIVITVDGDDTLRHNEVFSYLARIYTFNPHIWTTYGNWESDPPAVRKSICAPFPPEILEKNSFRQYPYISTHLRTFYAGLFHRIKKRHLMHEGKFYMTAGDVAFMMPILEMASKNHIFCVPEILYNYNVQNPINDFRKHVKLRRETSAMIRQKKPYKPLKKALWQLDLPTF